MADNLPENDDPIVPDRSPRQNDSTPRPVQLRFSLGHLMLVLTVCCAMGTAVAYLAQSLRGNEPSRLVFILFSLAAPPLLLVLISLVHLLSGWLGRRRR